MLANVAKQLNAVCCKNRIPMLSFLRHKAAYEGEGQTTIRVINQEEDSGLMIDSYATYGFRLNNGLTVLGPMAIFPRVVLSWMVTETEQITPESLALFRLLQPKIDLLVIGLEANDRSKYDGVFRAAQANNLNIEILTTEHACSTFNFLNSESRCVAAALIPPIKLIMNDDDMLQSNLHYRDPFTKSLV